MQQKTFHRINTFAAWVVFAIAAVVYGLTVEPTASLWDCPEFIACGYKLEIGHPPGAPVFMLMANLFSQLASTPADVALMVNLLSALLSAGCIFFLFLTVTHLARQLFSPRLTLPNVITIEACGVVGALAYTFSDTFWFSAVEAEVYAFSSFLTALMFWLILKWEDEADSPRSDRWIILTAYITGLSIGVHLLCLLCLPAMSFVVYFRLARRVTLSGLLATFVSGGLLVGVILYGLILGVVKLGGWVELLSVNGLGLPYNAGLAVYVVLLSGGLAAAYYRTGRRLVRLSLACVLMILAGYSSYGVIFIRANANPPMNENAPGNVFSLGSYLSREQYGDTPLVYGPAYCSEPAYERQGDYLVGKQKQGRAVYRPVYAEAPDSVTTGAVKQEYTVVRHDIKYEYEENMWFPRMHSSRHAQAYEDWMGGVKKEGNLPTAAENLRFFLTYQMNFMYWRYFLWNFVGRQNNIQGHGEVEHGNWITGIRWVDDWLLGCDTSALPSDLSGNKGRNVFFALPLLLGLAGIAWQWRRGVKGRQQLWMVVLLFVMTGLAIVVYLNQTPLQPRERDYAYAGSFYAFAIWIGLGAGLVTSWWQRLMRNRQTLAAALAAACSLAVPLQMASQTWDDHDRSGRYTCRDFGANYLESTQPTGNPIILTNGDNDTFPLWYNHDVEGVRTDARCCNMEYLQTDWYIDQMKRPAYDSPPLPISWRHEDYQEGRREYIPVRSELKEDVKQLMAQHPDEARALLGDNPFELKNIMSKWVLSDNPDLQCIPTDSVTIGGMAVSLKGKKVLYKNELMVLDMLANTDWRRPVYLSISTGADVLPFLREHMVLEGLAWRVSPTATRQQTDVGRLYDNVMHRFRFGNLSAKGLYVDEDVKRLANTHQLVMGILVDSLLSQGDTTRALAVCRKWQQAMPPENVPYTDAALAMARCYYQARLTEQGDAIVSSLLGRSEEWLAWIETITPARRKGSQYSLYTWAQTMQQALATAVEYGRNEICQQYTGKYERHIRQLQEQ